MLTAAAPPGRAAEPWHGHLLRQLRKLGLDLTAPPQAEAWQRFLESINRTYGDADRERYTLERSITLSSEEMSELNKRLAWERDQFAHIFHSAPAGMIRLELDGTLRELNPAFERIVGLSRAALVGRKLWDIGHPDDAASSRDRLEGLVAGTFGSETPAHVRFVHHSGDVAFTKVGLALVRDELGQPQWAIAVVEDVTERNRLEIELRLAQKLESVGRLAAGIAHEINTPIQFVGDNTSFLGTAFTELLALCDEYRELCQQSEGALSPEDRARLHAKDKLLERIRKNVPDAVEATLDGVSRVEHIVQSMKSFAHSDRGQRRPADLNAALRSTLTVANNELKYVAAVNTELGPLPPIPCYLSDLNQVFLNLFVNAAHAIGDVVGKTGARGTITVRSYVEGDEVVVAVGDTGSGIPPAIRNKIFDPFFTTKDVGRGTGQGLSLSRAVVVDQHGGTLTFETELGTGTTFYVRLPLRPDSSEPAVAD
jgi:two-component system NtrC family sensor kinase